MTKQTERSGIGCRSTHAYVTEMIRVFKSLKLVMLGYSQNITCKFRSFMAVMQDNFWTEFAIMHNLNIMSLTLTRMQNTKWNNDFFSKNAHFPK